MPIAARPVPPAAPRPRSRSWRRLLRGAAPAALLAAVLATPWPASAATTLQVSADPFTQATCAGSAATNHHTEVEPDTFASGSTIVAAYQVGRIFDGGACAIGFATSTDNGGSWTTGLLPGITKYAGQGSNDRATDASVAYDAAHRSWLVSSLTLVEAGGVRGNAVVTSRSADGLTWGNPVTTATGADLDKNWIACDNTASSPFYGHCYTEWDDFSRGNLLQMSTSTNGGRTWSAPATNNTAVVGGQPVVRPDGTVIVPTANGNDTAIGAFYSTDGGASWSAQTTIATVAHSAVAGSLRESPLPSAEIDGAGTVYVVWSDCRFRRSCKSNDIVVSHSTDSTGTAWSPVTRVPIDPTTSGVDHFIPGLAVNRTTSGAGAHLGLTYYFYPKNSTDLAVGFLSSPDGGSTWSEPLTLVSGMASTWTANTDQGRMVGDYISTSYGSDGLAHAFFGVAGTPTTGAATSCTTTGPDNCAEAMDSVAPGLAAGAVSGSADPVLFTGNGGTKAASIWHIEDNNGSKRRG